MIEGLLTNVEEEYNGSALAADAASGAVTIFVKDTMDFNVEEGGTFTRDLNGTETYAYTVVDELTGELAIVPGLSSAATAEDPIYIYPFLKEKWAYFREEPEGGEVSAVLPLALKDRLPSGQRDPAIAEAILAEMRGDRMTLADVLHQDPEQTAEFIRPNTFTAPPSDGVPPPSSPTPTVTGGASFLGATWSAVANVDPVVYEVHVSTTSGFVPSPSTKIGEVLGQGFVITKLPSGANLVVGTTYFVKTIAKDQDGAAPSSVQGSGSLVKLPSSSQQSDGAVPPVASAPAVLGGATFFSVRWTPVTNNDTVTYEVHVSTVSGFTPDGTTKFGETPGSSMIVNRTPAGAALVYGTTYYFKVIAKDPDGSAAASTQGSGQMVKLSGGATNDINADTITANELAANSVTAGELSANSVYANAIQTNTFSSQSIVADKFAAGVISGDRIVADSITSNEIFGTTLSVISADLGSITAGTITAGQYRTSATNPQVRIGPPFAANGLQMTQADGEILTWLDTSGLRLKQTTSSSLAIRTPRALSFVDTSLATRGQLYSEASAGLQKLNLVLLNASGGAVADISMQDDGVSQPAIWAETAGQSKMLLNNAGLSDYALLGVVNTFARRQVIAPNTDVPSLDLLRGTDTSPTANMLRMRRADATADLLTVDQFGHLATAGGVETKSKAGTISDADFGVVPGSGALAVDTTNSRLYARVGTTWKWAPLAAAATAAWTPGTFTARRAGSNTDTLANLANSFWTLVSDLRARGELA